jgi:TPR repeat protein
MPSHNVDFGELFADALQDDRVGLCFSAFQEKVMTKLLQDKLSVSDIEEMLRQMELKITKEPDALRSSNLLTMCGALQQIKVDYIKSFTKTKEADYWLAIKDYEKAICLGNTTAMNNRAYLMLKGDVDGIPNYFSAIKLFEQAIALGNVIAMYNRACMHMKGQGGPVNYPIAIELYEKAIALGLNSAMNNRALMHEQGIGGPPNYLAAIELYEKAIALGSKDAMYNRALMHEDESNGLLNYPAAINLYEQAIELGCAEAMNNRAVMYRKGLGGSVDYPAAIALYERAIALGSTSAMHNRAYMYEKGFGGPINYDAAIKLYEKAVALGNKCSLYNLAFIHFYGKGGSINYAASLSLLRQLSKLIAKEQSVYNDELKADTLDMLSKIALIENKDVYTQYQWLMMQYENAEIDVIQPLEFFRTQPAAFIKFITEDAALSEAEKNNHISLLVNFCIKHHTSIKQEVERDKDALNKKAAFEAMGNYFIQQVDKAMTETPVNLNKLLAYLAEVPSTSSAYRSALEQEADLLNSLVRDRELPLAEKFAIFSRIEYSHQEILHIDAIHLRDKVQGLEIEILALEKNPGSKPEIQALKRHVKEVQEKVKMIESLLQGHENTGLLKSLNWQDTENKNVLLYLQRKIDYAAIRRTWKEECIEKLKQQLWLAERDKHNFTSQYKLFSNKLSVIIKVQAMQKLLNLIQGINNNGENFSAQELATLKTYTLSKIMAEYKVLLPVEFTKPYSVSSSNSSCETFSMGM